MRRYEDEYASLVDGPVTEEKVKGSRFLGQAFAVAGEAAARERIDGLRRRHHAATHHCWAWRLGPPEAPRERCDDDGEPSGTAGRPLLAVLTGRDLYDLLVVVVRYYGGTKLGGGGLARAYGASAVTAVEAAAPRTIERATPIELHAAFDDLGAVEAVLSREGEALRRIERVFEPEPAIRLAVRPSAAARVRDALIEATAGRIRFVETKR